MRYKFCNFYDGNTLKGYAFLNIDGKISAAYCHDHFRMRATQPRFFTAETIEQLKPSDFPKFYQVLYKKLRLGELRYSDDLPETTEREERRIVFAWFKDLYQSEA